VFNKAKDDEGGSDNWSYKSCKAPVKSSPTTNQHPVFYRPDVLPVLSPKQQCQSTEGKDLRLVHGVSTAFLRFLPVAKPTTSTNWSNAWSSTGKYYDMASAPLNLQLYILLLLLLPHDAMHKRSLCCRPMSVCPSITLMYCIQTAEDIVKLFLSTR